MSLVLIKEIEVTSAGGTFTIDENMPPDVVFIYATNPLTLAANFTVALGGVPANGTSIKYIVKGVSGVTKDAYNFTIEGNEISEAQMQNDFSFIYQYASSAAGYQYSYLPQLDGGDVISGESITDNSVPLLKLESGASGQIIVGDNTGVPTYRTANGDVTISVLGTTTIGLGVITNQKINASAAIERSKLASGTAQHVLINDGSGVMSSEAQLSPVRGGLGVDASAATGFPLFTTGTGSIGALTETLRLDVSFETGWQGTYYLRVPFPCTVTAAKARVTKALSNTDAGTIQLKDNSGTDFGGGLITIPLSSAHGTGVTATAITANNVFTANQEIQFLVAKPTVGGACSIDVTITRLTLS